MRERMCRIGIIIAQRELTAPVNFYRAERYALSIRYRNDPTLERANSRALQLPTDLGGHKIRAEELSPARNSDFVAVEFFVAPDTSAHPAEPHR